MIGGWSLVIRGWGSAKGMREGCVVYLMIKVLDVVNFVR